MKYPIDVKAMRMAYRQNKKLELNENDEAFISALANVVNMAYEAGVKDATKQLNTV